MADEDSGLRAASSAHQTDRVQLGLLAGSLFLAHAHLVALVEQLDLLHFLESLAEGSLGVIELHAQLIGGALEVLAPRDRRLGIGRVGKVARVMDTGALLLDLDLAV